MNAREGKISLKALAQLRGQKFAQTFVTSPPAVDTEAQERNPSDPEQPCICTLVE